MKQYKVLRNCSGFKGRRWEKDMVVEFEDDATPPHHFELIKSGKKEAPKKEEPVAESFSGLTARMKKTPTSGFAKDYDGIKPDGQKTAGQALKNRKK